MRRLFHMSWLLLLIVVIMLFVWLRPIPANFLNYLIWKATTSVTPETGNISYKGAQIRYVSYGQGEPVLLLHGGLSNKLSWFSQIPWLVTTGRRVILIDTRGHGESTPGTAALSYQIFAQDTLQVLDKLGIQSTDIVGWSDGGITALLLGLEAPQRIRRIVAISANFNPSGIVPEATITDNEPPPNSLLTKINHAVRSWWSGAGDRHNALESEIKALWRTEPQLEHHDLQAITAPTLVIVGENDIIDLVHSSELAKMLTHGKLEFVADAGHSAPITHAPQINQLIANFLDINATF